MEPINLKPIQEIYYLWEPVYPYLGQQIHEFYNRQDGNILEIGPFSGVIFNLQKRKIGSSFLIASFPPGMANFFHGEARKQEVEDKIRVIETDTALTGIEENSIDLAIFRGAFFFPINGMLEQEARRKKMIVKKINTTNRFFLLRSHLKTPSCGRG